MSSIAALQQRISQLEQQKAAHEQEVSKLHRQSVDDLNRGDDTRAVQDEQSAVKEKNRVHDFDRQIQQVRDEVAALEREITNIDAQITQRHNQHVADQARLEQQLKVDLQQLESQKAKLVG